MLRFFRINDPYRLLSVFFILGVISLPLFINPAEVSFQELKSFVLGEALNEGKSLYIQVIDDAAPLTAWLCQWIDAIFGRSLMSRHVLALLLIFFQASYFAVLLINNKAYNENTYLPSLVFGLLAFYSFDMLALSPELIASTILLFALNNLFKEIEFKVQRDEIVLNLGIYLGIASLLIVSYYIFLLGTLIILFLFTRITFRKAMLLIFGFALPHALLISFYFFWDHQADLFQNFYAPNFTFISVELVSLKSIFVLGIIPITYFFFSLIMLNREAHFTKYQSQLMQVMFLWLMVALVEIFITRERTPHSFYTLIPPLAYFITNSFLLIRRKRVAELMLWILIIALSMVSWASLNGRITPVSYASIFMRKMNDGTSFKDKRILVLENEVSRYSQNRMAGYFLNWNLSKQIFTHPDQFENVILIYQSFQQDPPDIIIDKENLMNAVLERIPILKTKYKKEGNFYYKISN